MKVTLVEHLASFNIEVAVVIHLARFINQGALVEQISSFVICIRSTNIKLYGLISTSS